jgi:UDP-N-acetylmuramate dehydrogenase
MQPSILTQLKSIFGDRLQENVPLAGYTAARIGGPADALVFVRSVEELILAVERLWELDVPFLLLGGGANVLVSDKGVRGVVIINRARKMKFHTHNESPIVLVESGVTPNEITQRAAHLGLTGFEWAVGLPGSIGGAIFGNAGAFDSDIAGNLISLEIIHRHIGRQTWTLKNMEFSYRTSILKREHPPVVILSAQLGLSQGDPKVIRAKMDQFSERRRNTQPPGASLGSMFKNPSGEKAGHLIEVAGLKGKRIGNAEISTQHANFFINHGQTRADDMKSLIDLARNSVHQISGINLELEVELIGEW